MVQLSKPQLEPITKSRLFCDMVAFFHDKGIRYCIVGNTENFPSVIDSDVDIVVHPDDLEKSVSCLLDFHERYLAKVVQVIRHEVTSYYVILAAFDSGRFYPVFLQPDICSDYYRNGRFLLDALSLLEGRRLCEQGFYVPSDAAAFFYYLIKRIDKQDLDESHYRYLKRLFDKDADSARLMIRTMWKGEDGRVLVRLFDSGEYQNLLPYYAELRKAIYRARPKRLKVMIGELLRRLSRALWPTGVCFAVLGPDGAGKSTVIHALFKYLEPVFRRAEAIHLRPRLGIGRPASASPETNPHGKKNRGVLLSLAKLAYFWLDYTLGYAVLRFKRLAYSTVVAFDRYFVDLLIDPKRFRFSAPKGCAAFVEKIISHPQWYFLLDASAEVFQARKQEVSFEETFRQVAEYREWARGKANAHIIDAALAPDEIADQCAQIILDTMAERARRRHGR